MEYTKKEAEKKYPGAIFRGEIFWIGEDAEIGEGAIISKGAEIRKGAIIREGAEINTVCSRYYCNISPSANKISIRIGCEMHTVEDWTEELRVILHFKIDQGHKFICAWCGFKFGHAEIKGSHGICKSCYDREIAQLSI